MPANRRAVSVKQNRTKDTQPAVSVRLTRNTKRYQKRQGRCRYRCKCELERDYSVLEFDFGQGQGEEWKNRTGEELRHSCLNILKGVDKSLFSADESQIEQKQYA